MTQQDPTIETQALAINDKGELASWSENKREGFLKTYRERTFAAISIAVTTATMFRSKACEHNFISAKHTSKIDNKYADLEASYVYYRQSGRSNTELQMLAKERAADIYAQLPPLRKAVQLIDAKTTQLIDDSAKLRKKAQVSADALGELQTEFNMDEYEDMTVKAFKKMVSDTAKKKKQLYETMQECGAQAHRIDARVAKALYAGLPGISEACVGVIEEHLDKARGLLQLVRRVEEKVRYGDSEAACTLLSGFEKDELQVSEDTRTKIKSAMDIIRSKAKEMKAAEKEKAKALKAAAKPAKKAAKKKATKKGGKR
jgi:hypothetical protein